VAVRIDAQLSPDLAMWLRVTLSVDAFWVRDLGLRDAEDDVIFDRARAASAVVLTEDRDFAELVSRRGQPPQVVWLTCVNTSNSHLRGILTEVWPRVAILLQAGEPLVEIGGRAF